MSSIAVNVAVIHGNKVLLTQRDDFESWILPGGGVEDGESIAQAAIRETKEETGLDVELIRLKWFPFDQIPGPLTLGHDRRISDAISRVGDGVTVSQEFNLTNQTRKFSRRELYDPRDKSSLSQQEFYLQLVEQLEIKEEVELGNV